MGKIEGTRKSKIYVDCLMRVKDKFKCFKKAAFGRLFYMGFTYGLALENVLE